MKRTGRYKVKTACLLCAAVFSACFLDAVRNNSNDPKADNYDESSITKEWGTAVKISIEGNNSNDAPDIAMSPDGTAIAVWIDGMMKKVYALTSAPDKKGWGDAPVAINNYTVISIGMPKAAMNQAGNGMVVWIEQTDAMSAQIKNRYYSPDSGWVSNTDMVYSFAAVTGLIEMCVALFNDNGAFVCFSPDGNLIYRSSFYSNTWTSQNIDMNPRYNLGMSANGENAGICFYGSDGTNNSVFYAQYHSASNLMSSVQDPFDTSPSDDFNYPAIAMDDDSGKHLLFVKNNDDTGLKYMYGSGDLWNNWSWDRREVIQVIPLLPPLIAVTGDGTITIILWVENQGLNDQIHGRVLQDHSLMEDPGRIDSDDASGVSSPSLAIDNSGRAIVIWNQSNKIRASHFDPETLTWGDPVDIDGGFSGDNAMTMNLKVVMDDDGRAIAIWKYNNNIYANRYE